MYFINISNEIENYKPFLEEYLKNKGIDTSKDNFHCLNPNHTDRKPSMALNKRKNYVKCFACDAQYDIFDLIGIDYGTQNIREQIIKAIELFSLRNLETIKYEKKIEKELEQKPLKDFYSNGFYRDANKNVNQTDYFIKRGISQDIIKKYMLGYVKSYRVSEKLNLEAVVIPCTKNFYVCRLISKNFNIRYSSPKGASIDLFNFKLASKEKYVYVVEGAFDALSLLTLGIPTISLNSISNIKTFSQKINSLQEKPTLILCLDNDEAGKKATKDLIQLFDSSVSYVESNILKNTEFKDINEILIKDKKLLRQKIQDDIDIIVSELLRY